MIYELVYTQKAQRDLAKIDKLDAKRILKKLDEILKLEDPMKKVKKLKNLKSDYYRFRVGNYRVIFGKDQKNGKLVVLVVFKIIHRQGAYK